VSELWACLEVVWTWDVHQRLVDDRRTENDSNQTSEGDKMIAWLICKITGDTSLRALLRLRAEIRQLEEYNKKLEKKLRSRSEAMQEIVRTAKANCDDILFY